MSALSQAGEREVEPLLQPKLRVSARNPPPPPAGSGEKVWVGE